MKKIYTLSIIALLSAGMLAGCGSGDEIQDSDASGNAKETVAVNKSAENSSSSEPEKAEAEGTDKNEEKPKTEQENVNQQNSGSSQAESAEAQDIPEVSSKDLAGVTLSADDAYRIYSEKYPNSALEKISLDTEDGTYIYKVEGKANNEKNEMKINGETGEIVYEEKKKKDTDMSEVFSLSDVPNVNSLLNAALADAGPNYSLSEWKLNIDNNTLVMEVKVIDQSGSELEYKIDAMSGTIIEKDS